MKKKIITSSLFIIALRAMTFKGVKSLQLIYRLCILTRQSRGDPGYAEVDQGRVLGPRVLPQGPPTTSAPRNGLLDPTVPYAVPQKKKSKKPRSEPSEPGIGKLV